MEIVRWIVAGVAITLATLWLLFFVVALARGDERQQAAATRLRQWAQLLFMLWLNAEIWGRVIWTLITW